jgi:hypothetical protein
VGKIARRGPKIFSCMDLLVGPGHRLDGSDRVSSSSLTCYSQS